MANYNMKTAEKVLNELGMQAQLIPSPTNPRNCLYIYVNGIKIKSSQMSRVDIESALLEVKEMSQAKSTEIKSSQRLNESKENNYNESFYNNPDTLKKFKNLQDCLNWYSDFYEVGEMTAENYKKLFLNFHSIDEKTSKIDAIRRAKAERQLQERYNKGEVFNLHGYAYLTSEIKKLVSLWLRYNELNINPIELNNTINSWINQENGLVTV